MALARDISWGTLQGTVCPTAPLNGSANSGGDVYPHHRGDPLPDSRTFTFRGHDTRVPRRIDAAVADDWCWGAESGGEAIAGDGRCSTQGATEY